MDKLALLTGFYNYCMDNCDGELREYAIFDYLKTLKTIGDKVNFLIDTESYTGVIESINTDNNTANILTNIGLVMNVPITELNN